MFFNLQIHFYLYRMYNKETHMHDLESPKSVIESPHGE